MIVYLACLKKERGRNDDSCRNLAKNYLACRMERYVWLSRGNCSLKMARSTHYNSSNLMAKDDFKNLGFKSEESTSDAEQGKKGELRW
jgi:cytochrome c oxidase assembly protein subunit 19